MAEIDWNVDPAEMKPGVSREEEARRQQELNRTRVGLAKALNPFVSLPLEVLPIDQPTSLPQAGGLLGGVAALAFPEARILAPLSRLTQAAPAIARPFIPSLAGSAVGTTAGTIAEQALTNKDIFSTETGQKLLANNIENALFDVGGNLIFNFAGKAVKLGKDQLEKAEKEKSAEVTEVNSSDIRVEFNAMIFLHTNIKMKIDVFTKREASDDTYTDYLDNKYWKDLN